MKKTKNLVLYVLLLFGISSCIEPEIIPAPTPKAELNCHFSGTINGTAIDLTENVNGYGMTTTKAKILLPSPALSSAVYYSEMSSLESAVYVKLGLGSITWDAAGSTDPSISVFNAFFSSNISPVFSNNAQNGLEVTFRDVSGNIWVSKTPNVNAQNALFSSITQESDASGDYSKFTCNFNCYVYRVNPQTSTLDSLRIQNGKLTGWFQR